MSRHEPDDETARIGSSADLRRSVSQATDRIHEIIDAAERVAVEIRTDAETNADRYMADRKREADELAEARLRDAEREAAGRARALEQLTATLTDNAERFKQQVETMIDDLDRVIAEARSGLIAERPAEVVEERAAIAPLREVGSEPAEAPLRPPAAAEAPVAVADGERESQAAVDRTSEAVLRATQMAVTGKDREEIARTLAADFPAVDTESILDEILE